MDSALALASNINYTGYMIGLEMKLKKYGVIGCVLILIFLAAVIYYWIAGFHHLMAVEEIRYDNPNQSQIDCFLECCDLSDIHIENAEYLLISESPHKSDSLMAIVFSGDVTDWWTGFVSYPNGHSISLSNNNTLSYDAEKQISTFVCAYRLLSYGESKFLLRITNVSGEEIRQITELASLS